MLIYLIASRARVAAVQEVMMSIKLTQERLRQIIREEVEKVNEVEIDHGYDDPTDSAAWAFEPKHVAPELRAGQRRCWATDVFTVVSVDEDAGVAKIKDEKGGATHEIDIDMLFDSALVTSPE